MSKYVLYSSSEGKNQPQNVICSSSVEVLFLKVLGAAYFEDCLSINNPKIFVTY